MRWQLENRPGLYDGGIDWEGTLWRADGPNLFTSPYRAARVPGGRYGRVLRAGFAAGSQFLWEYHHQTYWELTQRVYRGSWAVLRRPESDYAYETRPVAVQRAVRRIELTGDIRRHPATADHAARHAGFPAADLAGLRRLRRTRRLLTRETRGDSLAHDRAMAAPTPAPEHASA